MVVEGELRVLKRSKRMERCGQRQREREGGLLPAKSQSRSDSASWAVYDCAAGAHSQSHRSADEAEWKGPGEAVLLGKD